MRIMSDLEYDASSENRSKIAGCCVMDSKVEMEGASSHGEDAGPIERARPFVKWAGGKGQILSTLRRYIPPFDGRYYEPFVGGGAMFFSLQRKCSFVSDRNQELINAYLAVKDSVEDLILSLRQHRNEEPYFYQVRGWDPASLTSIERASRLIFLNKTCFNGLYRVNQNGEFNVPFGKYQNPTICDEVCLRDASAALEGTHVLDCDFADAVAGAGEDDFVYLDPPYVPLSATSSFHRLHRKWI